MTLQAAESAERNVEQVILTGGRATTTNQLTVTVNMSTDDVNIIKQHLTLLRGLASSFLSIPPGFIADANGNPVVEINTSVALQASAFADN